MANLTNQQIKDTYPGLLNLATATTGITFGTAPTTVVTYYPPETTYLSGTAWGTPTVASSVSAPVY